MGFTARWNLLLIMMMNLYLFCIYFWGGVVFLTTFIYTVAISLPFEYGAGHFQNLFPDLDIRDIIM